MPPMVEIIMPPSAMGVNQATTWSGEAPMMDCMYQVAYSKKMPREP